MPVYDLKTMNTHLSGIALLFVRVGAALVGVFGLLGLALAVVGLYGVISHSVSQRTREIGVRIALGARPGDVLRMALKQGMILTLVGVVAGLAAAFAVTRLMGGPDVWGKRDGPDDVYRYTAAADYRSDAGMLDSGATGGES